MKLAYLVLDVRRPRRWQEFATHVLGLEPPVQNPDGTLGYCLGAAAQSLVLRPGGADDIAGLGLELADARALEALRARLAASDIEAFEGSPALCAGRRVERLVAFDDPEGTTIEAVVGAQKAPGPFASPWFPRGFGSEATGFGHAVLVTKRLAAMERFYVDVLGFAVTERLAARVGPLDVRGLFLHCNRRHHTLALMDLPSGKRLQHFMLEAGSVAEVVHAHERARRHRVPFSLGLGQHPDPDGTLSFYGRTPSGFDFEVGAGGREIDPDGWRELQAETTSAWGHAPTLGLQMRAAGSLIASRLGLQQRRNPQVLRR
jgi:2,3-dihydroxybiphenyl 1,2-dioxygenase